MADLTAGRSLFLLQGHAASDASCHINGVVLPVDGGNHVRGM